MEKSPIFLGAVGEVDGQTGVSLALDGDHSRQRRALGYLFTNAALLQEQHLLHVHAQKLVRIFKEKAAEKRAVDVSSWCKFFLVWHVRILMLCNTRTDIITRYVYCV